MSLLKRVTIENFQSHKKSILEFCPGINVIVGTSDAGKSAILRAIRWVLFNRPLGKSFIRNGEDSCEVTLEVGDEREVHCISYAKGAHSVYRVDEQVFKAVGTNTPEPINSLFSCSDVNLHRQLDAHFLVLESGGDVAKVLNETLKIDTIDKAVSLCSSKIRDVERNLILLRSQKDDSTIELKKYEGLDELIEKIVEWTEKKNIHGGLCKEYYELLSLLESVKKVEVELEEVKKIAKVDIEQLEILLEEYNELCLDESNLSTLIREVQKVGLAYDDSAVQLSELEGNEDELKKMYQEELKSLGRCPFCGKKVEDDLCKKLVENL